MKESDRDVDGSILLNIPYLIFHLKHSVFQVEFYLM